MADFDDLLPSTSNTLPTLDNPFEDPFAGAIGRPRSPDPWAAASLYQSQPPSDHDEPHDNTGFASEPVKSPQQESFSPPQSPTPPRVDTAPTIPPVASSPSPKAEAFSREYLLRSPTSPLRESFRASAAPVRSSTNPVFPTGSSVDPLEALISASKEDTPPRRNPLGPLPILPKQSLPPDASIDRTPAKDTSTTQKEDPASSTALKQESNLPSLTEDTPAKTPIAPSASAPAITRDPLYSVAAPLKPPDVPKPTIISPLDPPPTSSPNPNTTAAAALPPSTSIPAISTPLTDSPRTPIISNPPSPSPALARSSSNLSLSGGTSSSNYSSAISTPAVHPHAISPNPDSNTTANSHANHNHLHHPHPHHDHNNREGLSLATSQSSSDSTPATIRYDRVVSPLESPAAPSAITNSFAGLSLGGEVPGWGGSFGGSTFVNQERVRDSESESTGEDQRERETSPDARSVNTVRNGEPLNHANQENKLPPPFIITVGDPQKVGDPISAHILYTVHTRTTSPLFRKSEFSVLRRYSDFLWLFSTLSSNNPGVVVPPVPEKNPFGRFQDSFVEGRRLALNKCIQKIANHPLLGADPDLKLFLESDSFALDIKHRKGDERGSGLIATIGSTIAGPKFSEIDEWFDNKKSYLDILESQLRGLAKSIEVVAKHRIEVALANAEFAEAIASLSTSELSKPLSQSLSQLADVERRAKDLQETQAKDDAVTIMGTVDEYCRLINSVRLAFASRVKAYGAWQYADSESRRIKSAHEKARKQGRIPTDRLSASLNEIGEFERRAHDAKREFDNVSRLVKSEVARFEHERIEDFKASMSTFLKGMIEKQKLVIRGWETYQEALLHRIGANPAAHPPPQ